MASRYSIMGSNNGHGCRVEVVDGYGVRHTMLGFDTELDAKRWIDADKQRDRLQTPDALHDTAD